MCGTYFGSSSQQKSTVRPCAGRSAVSFKLHGLINIVFTRLSAAAFIFFNRLKGGGVYSRAALIRGRRLNIGQNKQYV